jgi:hypothetical protein
MSEAKGAEMVRMTKSVLGSKSFALLLFAAIITATLVFLLSCCFAADSVIRDMRAIWHATGLHFPYAAGFFATVPWIASQAANLSKQGT